MLVRASAKLTAVSAAYDIDPFEELRVPRGAVELPLRVPIPAGFDPARLETWPRVEGRLEYVCLLYTSPSPRDS